MFALSDVLVARQARYTFAVSDMIVFTESTTKARVVEPGAAFCDGLGGGASMAVSLSVEHGSKVFVEAVSRLVLTGTAVFALAYWLRCLHVSADKVNMPSPPHLSRTKILSRTTAPLTRVRSPQFQVLPEQQCITAMLLALLLHDDPFYGLSILYGGVWVQVSMACNAVAVSLFLVLWLILIDSLANGDTIDGRSRRGKLLLKGGFALLYALAGFMRRAYSSSALLSGGSAGGSLDKLSESGGYWAFVWLLLTWTWATWFSSLVYKASRTLRTLPYLETRYRQLSFQFFQLQSAIVCLYFLIDLTVSVVFSGDHFVLDSVEYSLPEAVLFEVACPSLAFVCFLPCASRGASRRSRSRRSRPLASHKLTLTS